MPQPHLRLDLKNGSACFKPGETLAGQLLWSGVRARKLVLRIGWSVGNEKTQELMVHATEDVAATRENGYHPFEVILPEGPLSYRGTLFSVRWWLEACTDDGKHMEQLPITLL